MKILAFAASLRRTSLNRKLIALASDVARSAGAQVDLAEFREFELPIYDGDLDASAGLPAGGMELKRRVEHADAIMIAAPEYNFSVAGPLKNAIDWVSRLQNQPFAGKPIALQSASPGPLGGGRVQYDLRRAMVFLDAFVLNKPEIFIGACATKLDDKTGEIKDEATRNFIKQQLAAFVTFIGRVAVKA